jgi:hypothetical protein
MQPVPPAMLELAQRLRSLRREQWPGVRVTQAALANAFGSEADLAAVTVSSWESLTTPRLPPRGRIDAYARFFATHRSVEEEPYQLLKLNELTEQEKATYAQLLAELMALHNAVRGPSSSEAIIARRSWSFPDSGPATMVCALIPEDKRGQFAEPTEPNYTELHSYADLDALVELHGHIRAENPSMDVFYKAAPNVLPDDLSGHVILLGGIAWNAITKRLSSMTNLPVQQVQDPSLDSGEIFVVNVDGSDRRFFPTWDSHQRLIEDVGLLARVPNPLNSSRTLTICNGIHSRGVLGAVRSLTDARLRESNERYIAKWLGSSESFVVLARVQVIEGETMTPDFKIPDTVLYRWSSDSGN